MSGDMALSPVISAVLPLRISGRYEDLQRSDILLGSLHQPIIARELWDKVHSILQESPRKRAANTRGQNTPALLKGLLFGPNGLAFTPAYTRRGKRLYRYYVSTGVIKRGPEACPIRRVASAEIERAVVDQVRAIVNTPEVIVRTWKEARRNDGTITEEQVRAALVEFSELWDELFPAEQTRIVQLLVHRIDIRPDGLDVTLRSGDLTSLTNELRMKAAA